MIYLDNGATTFQKPPQVMEAVAYAMTHYASPGRGGYPAAMEAGGAVFAVREQIGELFDAAVEQVVFTTSATHGLNIAIKSLVKPGDRVVVSGFEHNAVVRPLYALDADIQVAGQKLFDQTDTLNAFDRAITADTNAVICTHVSNVFGYVLPVERIANLCRQRRVPFIIDASQSAGILSLSLQETGADFVAMPGHKGLYGPQGTGILLCNRPAKPLLEGGTGSNSRDFAMPEFLPDGLEAGTQNVAGIWGLGAGIGFVAGLGVDKIREQEGILHKKMVAELYNHPNIRLFTGANQIGVLSFQVEGMDCQRVAEVLGEAGIAVRSGLHCAPMAHQSGGTLEAGTVRASVGIFNTMEEIGAFVKVLQKIPQGNRQKLPITT